jgi:hypothetical protein
MYAPEIKYSLGTISTQENTQPACHWGSGGDSTQRHAGRRRPGQCQGECGQGDLRDGRQSRRTGGSRSPYSRSRSPEYRAIMDAILRSLRTRVARLEVHAQGTDRYCSDTRALWLAGLRPAPIILKQSPSQTSLMPSWTRRLPPWLEPVSSHSCSGRPWKRSAHGAG